MKVPEPRKLSSGTWFLQMRLNGVSVPVTASTRKECIDKATLIKAEHRTGKRVVANGDYNTLGQAIDSFISARENVLSPSTIRGYKAYRESRFLAYMDIPIKCIDWQKMINAEAKMDISPKSIKNAWGLVKSAIAEFDITPSVRLPAPIPHEKLWLTPEQIPSFLSAIKDKTCEIGALLALSGLRRSEIYGLDWNDIDLKKKVIHVHQSVVLGEDAKPVTRNKNKTVSSTRDVPIFLPQLLSSLRAVKDKTGKVVPGNIGTLRKQLAKVCKDANLPDIGVHGLRHSFASLCYSLGVSELGAMQIGGWNDFQTMRKIYTHLSDSDKKKSADALNRFFKNANKNANKPRKSK